MSEQKPALPAGGSIKILGSDTNASSSPPSRNRIKGVANPTPRANDRVYKIPNICYELPSGIKVEVTIERPVCELLMKYCSESNRHGREIGGVLVGDCKDSGNETPAGSSGIKTYYVRVTNLIPARSSDSSGAHIRFSANFWSYVDDECRQKYSDKVRLGWYHTHPTQGIFFSDQDRNAHSVFKQPYQFALVVDPRGMETGLFYWENAPTHLGEPLRFKLSPTVESVVGDGAKDEVAKPKPDERRIFSPIRLGTFLLGVFALTVFTVGTQAPELKLNPDHACFLAVLVFLGLRFWNAGYFHPQVYIELIIAKKFFAGLIEFGFLIKRYPIRFASVPLLVLIIAVGALVIRDLQLKNWQAQSPKAEKPTQETQPTSGSSSVEKKDENTDTVPKIKIVVKDYIKDDKITLQLIEPSAQIEYHWLDDRQKWYPKSPSNLETEKQFFKKAFSWDIKFTPNYNIGDLQKVIGIDPDLQWGQTTRNAFLAFVARGKKFTVSIPDKVTGKAKKTEVVLQNE